MNNLADNHQLEDRRLIDRLSSPLVHFMERYYPDLFLFIILITLTTFFLAYWTTEQSPQAILFSWGNSLGDILTFTMQMSLMVMISHALAHTDSLQRLLHKLGSVPKTATQAYGLAVLVPGIACLISWPLGIIAGGIVARKIGESTRDRDIRVHYPLLVASAMCGNVVWHMGYSASAPLFVATEDNSMMALMGGIVPMTDTVFTTWNLILAASVLITMIFLAGYLRPRSEETIELRRDSQEYAEQPPSQTDSHRPVAALENSRWFTVVVGVCLLLFLFFWFSQQGFKLNLNIVNWSFLSLLLVLCRSAKHFMYLVEKSAVAVGPLILAYPFYAGIMGVMVDSGMGTMVSTWFSEIATQQTLPLWAFLAAMVVNLFIPSGGGQWIIQGPIFIETANTLNVDLPLIVMAIAYGDQLTNLIQPLPAIPLLALAGLKIKHIMGYMFIFCVTGFVLLGGGLMIISLSSAA
ncbi:TIGR00366 family protein [Aestuariicella sp. G3-2]|uniref:short-chain fatty acid transporter n=1 Tax=Pseudomaricurvus albidus TaxID=2842452 RepID=UPI001C0DB286|nr:TIGR00366 family protein [Aestuariicella albida]MBU3068563.1 TIGR00366 family protein [Aestuariicella albida]